MIGRSTTLTLAQLYAARFSSTRRVSNRYGRMEYRHQLSKDSLYDFLYRCGYDAWFLNLAKALQVYDNRALKELILKLHTGESVAAATPNCAWKQRVELGQQLLRKLSEDMLLWFYSLEGGWNSEFDREVDQLVKQLELDGYVFRKGKLLFSEAAVLDTNEEQGLLGSLVNELALDNATTIDHHLELSETHYIEERWDDSISNSRKFLESVLQEVAAKHCLVGSGQPLGQNRYTKPVEVRKYLEEQKLIYPKETAAIAAGYALLSETGGHPYIAARDQARLLRYLALTFAQFILLRLRGALEGRG